MPTEALAQFDPSHPPTWPDASSISDTAYTDSLALPLYTGDYDQGLSHEVHEMHTSLSNTGYDQEQPADAWDYQVDDSFDPAPGCLEGSGGEMECEGQNHTQPTLLCQSFTEYDPAEYRTAATPLQSLTQFEQRRPYEYSSGAELLGYHHQAHSAVAQDGGIVSSDGYNESWVEDSLVYNQQYNYTQNHQDQSQEAVNDEEVLTTHPKKNMDSID